jgi:hypothetical protein
LQRDPFKLTILYLRLWKICDAAVQPSEHQSAKFFEIAKVEPEVLENELVTIANSKLEWADNRAQVLDDIKNTLLLCRKPNKSESDFNVLSSYRSVFQEKALTYSGELTMVSSHGA